MAENASKKKSTRTRAPAVQFKATETGLSIRIAMSHERAKAIEEKAVSTPRAKAKASRTALSALPYLENEDERDRRDRSGFLQADIPAQLKAKLAEVAKARGKDITGLVFDHLSKWINPNTGKRRIRRIRNGLRYYEGPTNYRNFASSIDEIYSEALRSGTLVRLQVEIGNGVALCIDGLLIRSRVSKGRFLTAVAADVLRSCSQAQPVESAEKIA